jgi:hypothetical protein
MLKFKLYRASAAISAIIGVVVASGAGHKF